MEGLDGKYGAITTERKELHPGEPVFLLRATDPVAPMAIREYAFNCERRGCDPEHVAAAVRHAQRMEEWQEQNADLVKDKPGPGGMTLAQRQAAEEDAEDEEPTYAEQQERDQ